MTTSHLSNTHIRLIIETLLEKAPFFRAEDYQRRKPLLARSVKEDLTLKIRQEEIWSVFSTHATDEEKYKLERIGTHPLYAVEISFGRDARDKVADLAIKEYIRLIPLFGPLTYLTDGGARSSHLSNNRQCMLMGIDKCLFENLDASLYQITHGGYANKIGRLIAELLEDRDILKLYGPELDKASKDFIPERHLGKLSIMDPKNIRSSFATQITAYEFSDVAQINVSASLKPFSP